MQIGCRNVDLLPSLAAGETMDKGYINQRAVLKNRAAIVDSLYAGANCVARYPASLSSTSIVDGPGGCHFASDSGALSFSQREQSWSTK